MKKTLFLVSSLNIGGIEKYLLRFLKHTKGDINPTVFCKHGYSGVLHNDYIKAGAKIDMFRLSYFSVKNYYKFYKYLNTGNFYTICDFTGDFAGIPLFIARLAKVKNRIVFYRNSDNQFRKSIGKNLYVFLLNKLLNISATKFLSNSFTALDTLQIGWRNNNTELYRVIYNGIPHVENTIDLDLIKMKHDIPVGPIIIGHVGSFRKSKNHLTILKTASELKKRNIDFRIVFVGNSVSEGTSNDISSLDIYNHVICLGMQKDIPEILAIFDVFIFPSIHEGLPNALFEAIIAGIPVVTSNISPITDVLPEEMTPIYRDPYDFIGFADLIIRTIRKELYSTDAMKEWAIKTFNVNIQFGEFIEELKK